MTKREFPNVTETRKQARQDWEKEFKGRLSIQERVRESVPWWLVVVAGVFFLLSMPHTANVFEKITPDYKIGRIAPLGIEFGLLYASFRRRIDKQTWQLIILEVLLFGTAIIVNGAGALEAVVASTQDVQGLSITQLLNQLDTLPATSQVALVLVPVAAFIIPIGTVVAGEGLASLALERREDGNVMLEEWDQVRQDVEYMGLRDAAINLGHTPKQAKKWAAEIMDMELSVPVSGVSGGQRTGQKSGQRTGQKRNEKTDAVLAYLDTYGYADQSVRQLSADVSAEYNMSVGKTVASSALNEWNARRNGQAVEVESHE